MASGDGQEVHANAFVLKDERGATRVWLGLHNGRTALELYDESSVLRLMLAVDPNLGPALLLHDRSGNIRISVTEADGGLVVSDQKGGPRLRASATEAGSAFALLSGRGRVRAVLGLTGEDPQLSLFAADGEELFSAP